MRIVLYRLLAVLLPLAILEILCRDHVITPLTLPAPSRILLGLWMVIKTGAFNAAILKTLTNVGLAFVLVATLYSSINTFAQSAEFNPRSLGTTDAGFPIRKAPTSIGTVSPFLVVSSAQYSSGGVALRNRGTGAIHVSGVIAPAASC